MIKVALRPAFTLDQIFGDDHWFSPQQPEDQCRWTLPIRYITTGGPLTYAGNMPVLCSHRVVHPEALDLLRYAGLPITEQMYVFADEGEYRRKFAAMPGRAVTNYVYAESQLPDEKSWIPQRVLADVNNKAYLSRLVPKDYRPRRRCMSAKKVRTARIKAPVVIKVATPLSSGSGVAVRLCRTQPEVVEALHAFAGNDLVIEKFLTLRRTWNVQFASLPDGQIQYLGASEQIANSQGAYEGNWVDKFLSPPNECIEVGKRIVMNAMAVGYRGVAGIDFGECQDGRVFALDLNFRINGSTALVLFAQDLLANAPVLRVHSFISGLPLAQTVSIVKAAVDENWFLPLSFFDGPYLGQGSSLTRGVVMGADRIEVSQRVQWLADRLLS